MVRFCGKGEIRVDDDVAVCRRAIEDHCSEFHVIGEGEKVVGLKSLNDGMWDVTCETIVALHGDENLSLCPIGQTGNKVSFSIERSDNMEWLYAGLNYEEDAISVFVVGPKSARRYEIALADMENEEFPPETEKDDV
jgi:hypothetical protein